MSIPSLPVDSGECSLKVEFNSDVDGDESSLLWYNQELFWWYQKLGHSRSNEHV